MVCIKHKFYEINLNYHNTHKSHTCKKVFTVIPHVLSHYCANFNVLLILGLPFYKVVHKFAVFNSKRKT